MTLSMLVTAALILGTTAALQAAVGFGMGMASVPLLLWTGFSLPESVALVLGAATVQMSVGLYGYRRHVDLKQSLPIAGFQCLSIPVGVFAMGLLASLGKEPVQQAVGAAILAALAFRQLARPTPRPSVPFWWGAVAGTLTGFLAGMVGMGGPPIVFYALSHEWLKEKFRAFLWTQFLLANPIILVVLTLRFGSSVPAAFGFGVLAMPLVFTGQAVSLRLTEGWDSDTLQRAAVGLLAILGVTSLVRPLLG